jgi:YD repeat-containing protein
MHFFANIRIFHGLLWLTLLLTSQSSFATLACPAANAASGFCSITDQGVCTNCCDPTTSQCFNPNLATADRYQDSSFCFGKTLAEWESCIRQNQGTGTCSLTISYGASSNITFLNGEWQQRLIPTTITAISPLVAITGVPACSQTTVLNPVVRASRRWGCNDPPDLYGAPFNTPTGKMFCSKPATQSCPLTQNPVSLPRGTKLQTETSYPANQSSPLSFAWTYHYFGFADWVIATGPEQYRGRYWFHSYDRVLWSNDPIAPTSVVVRRPDGMTEGFVASGVNFVTNGDSTSVLTAIRNVSNQITGWRLELDGDQVEEYDVAGKLVRLSNRTEHVQTLAYNAQGRLATVTDQRGRQMSFGYNAEGRINTLTTPDGVYGYVWNGLNLLSTTYPGGSVKTYHYENAAQPNAMTGVTDERNQRWTTYAYRSDGFVQSTSMAGGVNTVAYNFTQTGGSVSSVTMTNPLGLVTTYGMTNAGGKVKLSTVNNPCPSCGDGKTKSFAYDSTGKIDTQTDFRNQLTDIDYNSRALEIRRIEAKNLTVSPFTINPERRIIETDWHSSFRVPVQRRVCAANATNTCPVTAVGPNLIGKTNYAYNARGQLLSVSQIDPNNAGNVRTTTTTYCDAINGTNCPLVGLVLSVNGPRTDVNDVMSYSYRMSNASDGSYKTGDLWKVTNALNQVVEYLAYDGAGRATQVLDANGVLSTMSYHPRGWLASRTVRANVSTPNITADATTIFAYTPFGRD